MALDLMRAPYDLVEVPYSDRDELAQLTGGYIYVPVLVLDDGEVLVESRNIVERLVAMPAGKHLVPSPWEGPIWAFHDFSDGALEDVLFRIASPAVRDAWTRPGRARAVHAHQGTEVRRRLRRRLGPRARHPDRKSPSPRGPVAEDLSARPYLFGDTPTLADVSLYAQCIMLDEADPTLLPRISPALVAFARALESVARLRRI
jgi:glutathione S-transferase